MKSIKFFLKLCFVNWRICFEKQQCLCDRYPQVSISIALLINKKVQLQCS